MLQCETITPDALDQSDREAWIRLARQTGLESPLVHPDFARVVGKVREDTRIALYRDRHGLAAVFAHHRRPGGFARPIGANFSDMHAILTRAGLDVPVSQLLRMAGVSRARFSAVFTGEEASPDGMEPVGPSQATILRSTPEALVEELRADNPKRFKDWRRRLRRLEDDHGPVSLEVCEDMVALVQLMGWKREQFRATGKHDVLAPRWASRLMHALFEGKGGEVKGRLFTLKAGGRIVAAEFGPQAHGTFHPWLAGYDPDMAAYSPGHMLVYQLIETMPALGLKRYEMGTGHEDYKKYFTNHVTHLHAGMVRAPGAASLVRDSAASLLSGVTALGGDRVAALAGRLHRRIDQIASVETSMTGRLAGMTRAATQMLVSPGR
ncbi:MAG: GNAT family N-acetyltransferase [Glycocaulis sp.]